MDCGISEDPNSISSSSYLNFSCRTGNLPAIPWSEAAFAGQRGSALALSLISDIARSDSSQETLVHVSFARSSYSADLNDAQSAAAVVAPDDRPRKEDHAPVSGGTQSAPRRRGCTGRQGHDELEAAPAPVTRQADCRHAALAGADTRCLNRSMAPGDGAGGDADSDAAAQGPDGSAARSRSTSSMGSCVWDGSPLAAAEGWQGPDWGVAGGTGAAPSWPQDSDAAWDGWDACGWAEACPIRCIGAAAAAESLPDAFRRDALDGGSAAPDAVAEFRAGLPYAGAYEPADAGFSAAPAGYSAECGTGPAAAATAVLEQWCGPEAGALSAGLASGPEPWAGNEAQDGSGLGPQLKRHGGAVWLQWSGAAPTGALVDPEVGGDRDCLKEPPPAQHAAGWLVPDGRRRRGHCLTAEDGDGAALPEARVVNHVPPWALSACSSQVLNDDGAGGGLGESVCGNAAGSGRPWWASQREAAGSGSGRPGSLSERIERDLRRLILDGGGIEDGVRRVLDFGELHPEGLLL